MGKHRLNVLLFFVVLSALVSASGCGTAAVMQRTDLTVMPDKDFAVVNFLRPSSLGGAIKFGVWDRENLVGVITPQTIIQYKATPGEHLFMARAENWAGLKATVEAGKNYYVLVAPRMGAWKARVDLSVLKPDDRKVKEWMGKLDRIMVDTAQHDAYVAERINDVRKAAENFQSGRASYDTMGPTDGN